MPVPAIPLLCTRRDAKQDRPSISLGFPMCINGRNDVPNELDCALHASEEEPLRNLVEFVFHNILILTARQPLTL